MMQVDTTQSAIFDTGKSRQLYMQRLVNGDVRFVITMRSKKKMHGKIIAEVTIPSLSYDHAILNGLTIPRPAPRKE